MKKGVVLALKGFTAVVPDVLWALLSLIVHQVDIGVE